MTLSPPDDRDDDYRMSMKGDEYGYWPEEEQPAWFKRAKERAASAARSASSDDIPARGSPTSGARG